MCPFLFLAANPSQTIPKNLWKLPCIHVMSTAQTQTCVPLTPTAFFGWNLKRKNRKTPYPRLTQPKLGTRKKVAEKWKRLVWYSPYHVPWSVQKKTDASINCPIYSRRSFIVNCFKPVHQATAALPNNTDSQQTCSILKHIYKALEFIPVRLSVL